MRLSDFVLDPTSGVRFASAGAPAGYLDGAERHLLAVLQEVEDRSVASDELARHVVDWPTLYHLSPYRSTLFDAFGWTGAPASVLELGAGCGAITRWLGEHAGRVDAVEGDPTRAAVARLRCADQPNVEVYAGNFSELDAAGYDVATLVGVLEYSHLYHPRHQGDPERAASANLRLARRSLDDDGLLVVSIENRLGLKYFNGAREDHSGKVFESIHGYPHATGAVTFSAPVLEELMRDAGFTAFDWFLPFPDYKLPRTIINAERVGREHRIHNFIGSPAPGRGVDRDEVPFNETLAFREVADAGLLQPLSNSLHVLAYAGDPAATRERLGLDTGWVARHWSLDRRRGFRKRVTLRDEAAGPVVLHEPHGLRAPVAVAGAVRQELRAETFRRGDLALIGVFETLAAAGAGEGFLDHVRDLRDWVLAEYGTGSVDDDGVALVDGRAVDATWWNVAVDPHTGDWQSLDEEFSIDATLPVDWIVWRSLRHLCERHGPHLPPEQRDPASFAAAWTARVLPDVTPARLAWLEELEQGLGRAIGPAGVLPPPESGVEALDELAGRSARPAVLAFAEDVVARPQLLREFRDAGDGGSMLLIYAPGADPDRLVPRLTEALGEGGLLDGATPIVVLLHPPADARDVGAVAARCTALLGDDASHAGLDLPRFGAAAVVA